MRRPYVLYLTTVDDLEQMRVKAMSDIEDVLVDLHARSLRCEVQRGGAEGALERMSMLICATCRAHLDPHDIEYREKLKRIAQGLSGGVPLPRASCGA